MLNNLKNYNNVFCDSKEALEWLYDNGLPKNALIRTSSPSLLLDKNNYNIEHVENRWSVKELKHYQTSINKFVKSIYQAVRNVDGINHERSLAVSLAVLNFHKKIYKAACLTEFDLTCPRLIVQINKGGMHHINSPWDKLLSINKNIKIIEYSPKNNALGKSKIHKLPWLDRYRLAGIETIVFRVAEILFRKIPNFIKKKEIIIPSENELVIEIMASLIAKGVAPTSIDYSFHDKDPDESIVAESVWSKIQPIVNKRLKKWVVSGLVERCEVLLFNNILETLNNVEYWKFKLDPYFKSKKKNKNKKIAVLSNTLVKNKGFAIVECCRKYNIPVISVQHGVTYEICATHDEMNSVHEVNLSDKLIVYNDEAKIYAENTGFSHGDVYTAGISSRHMRTRLNNTLTDYALPIVFISSNLYKGNFGLFSTWETDFDRAKKEFALIKFVFSKLPYSVRYKAYPEENKRYIDNDPLLEIVESYDNIELYDEKVDMRYLIKQHRIFVTTKATSTLSWLIMSGKPVVFINSVNNMPLTSNAHMYFSNGLFLFDDNSENFYKDIRKFLSQPICDIEKQWKGKKDARKLMIKYFFSLFSFGAGSRAANLIYNEYLK